MSDTFTIRADNRVRDLRFKGEQIAEGSNWNTNGNRNNRWTSYELYRTESEKVVFVTHYHTMWQGEEDDRTVYVYESLQELEDYFELDEMESLAEWQKEFLEEAGIEIVEDI